MSLYAHHHMAHNLGLCHCRVCRRAPLLGRRHHPPPCRNYDKHCWLWWVLLLWGWLNEKAEFLISLDGSDGCGSFNYEEDTFFLLFFVKLVLRAMKLNSGCVVVAEDTMPRLQNKLKMEANVLAIL